MRFRTRHFKFVNRVEIRVGVPFHDGIGHDRRRRNIPVQRQRSGLGYRRAAHDEIRTGRREGHAAHPARPRKRLSGRKRDLPVAIAGCEVFPAAAVAVPVAGSFNVPRTVAAPFTSSVMSGVVIFTPILAVLPVPD